MKKLVTRSAIIMLISSTSLAYAAKADVEIKTEKQQFSYAIGVQIGNNMKRDKLDIDIDAMGQAIQDVLAGKELRVSQDDLKKVVTNFTKKREEEAKKQSEQAKKDGETFLAKNKKKKGVVTLPSGLQYKVLTEGKGKKPAASDTVEAHYHGTLIDGTVFDSSVDRGEPATFPVNGVIKGWQEILQLMPIGSKWQVYIPSSLAYGARGAGNSIGPNQTLIFDIELLKIK